MNLLRKDVFVITICSLVVRTGIHLLIVMLTGVTMPIPLLKFALVSIAAGGISWLLSSLKLQAGVRGLSVLVIGTMIGVYSDFTSLMAFGDLRWDALLLGSTSWIVSMSFAVLAAYFLHSKNSKDHQ